MDRVLASRSKDEQALETVASRLTSLLDKGAIAINAEAFDCATQILRRSSASTLKCYAELLYRTCLHLFEVGQSTQAISLGIEFATCAERLQDIVIQRRISNIVGGQYVDIADFSSAMRYLDVAVQLARKIGDPTIEAACLANVVAVLQEMGHYRQAISMARRVLALKDESPNARTLKVQCASNGLFASHRIDDSESAAHFLDMGQRFISRSTDPLRLSFFERSRVLYLVDLGQTGRARECLAATLAVVDVTASPRFNTLLTIADSICKWAEGDKSAARESLRSLYVSSKSSRLYHHFVLQGLIKVYADASIPGDVSLGINYAKELVEYTTGVKKAKFYRQLATRREEAEQKVLSAASSTSIDPFGQAREWLSLSEITVPLDDAGERRQLVKHEELTAIHEDMAKLRAMSIRREIRTDAVDTAENWAIAAEFFDDETGQHCYRVGHLATMLAREIGMDETFCVQVEHAARLHDIGKIAVNEVILLKPGPLDASEMAAMRLHTEVGAQILAGSDDPTLKMAVEVARHHHEWWNGAGYPVKLSGRDIPISARICAYADVYDALTHMRSYKKAWTHERAVEEITRLGGIQFDPDLLGPFTAVLERYRSDLAARAIPGFADMDSNSLIASRRKLMETIGAGT